MRKIGQWPQARTTMNVLALSAAKALDRAVLQEAQLYRTLVVRSFTTGGRSNGKAWPKLQPETKKRKGSSKPLIDTGQLRNSIGVIKGDDGAFVGVPSKVKRKGRPLVDIAWVHEYGKVIAQRRGGGAVIIKIPQRSFLQATFDTHFKGKDLRARMAGRISFLLNLPGVSAPPKARALAAAAMRKAK